MSVWMNSRPQAWLLTRSSQHVPLTYAVYAIYLHYTIYAVIYSTVLPTYCNAVIYSTAHAVQLVDTPVGEVAYLNELSRIRHLAPTGQAEAVLWLPGRRPPTEPLTVDRSTEVACSWWDNDRGPNLWSQARGHLHGRTLSMPFSGEMLNYRQGGK